MIANPSKRLAEDREIVKPSLSFLLFTLHQIVRPTINTRGSRGEGYF